VAQGDIREAHSISFRHSRESGNPEVGRRDVQTFSPPEPPLPLLAIPAKAGIQERTLRRNAPPFFDLPPFGRENTNRIPAFAGRMGWEAGMILGPRLGVASLIPTQALCFWGLWLFIGVSLGGDVCHWEKPNKKG
jgi:hypothetical protein